MFRKKLKEKKNEKVKNFWSILMFSMKLKEKLKESEALLKKEKFEREGSDSEKI